MPFLFKQASCAVVGTFNIYIIQPKWLQEIGLYKDGLVFRFETDVRHPGFRLSVQDESLTWNVRPDRLVVSSDLAGDDCGRPIGSVLEYLAWTPLRAIGANQTFCAKLSDTQDLIGRFLPDCTYPQEYTVEQRTWHRALKRDDSVFNFQLSVNSDEVELATNIHTQLTEFENQQDASTRAQEVARLFLSQLETARELASNILEVELSHDPANV